MDYETRPGLGMLYRRGYDLAAKASAEAPRNDDPFGAVKSSAETLMRLREWARVEMGEDSEAYQAIEEGIADGKSGCHPLWGRADR
jgi:hypothetical protein